MFIYSKEIRDRNIKMKKSRLEEKLEKKGFKLIDEILPFRMYQKGRKRIVYHIPSAQIWGKFKLEDQKYKV